MATVRRVLDGCYPLSQAEDSYGAPCIHILYKRQTQERFRWFDLRAGSFPYGQQTAIPLASAWSWYRLARASPLASFWQSILDIVS